MSYPTTAQRSGAQGSLKSVTSALDLLDCFEDEAELGVTEIARQLGLAKSTAHRLLTALRGKGLIEQDAESGLYRLGLHLVDLGQLARRRNRLRCTALPVLEELRTQSAATVQLGVRDGEYLLYIERLFADPCPVEVADLPYRVAFGADVPVVVGQKHTTAFRLDIIAPGVGSVSAPVVDPGGVAVASVSCIGPIDEIRPAAESLTRLVVSSAVRLSRRESVIGALAPIGAGIVRA